MKKLLVPILLSLGTCASAAFLPSTSTLVNQGYPGTTDWPVRLGTTTANQGTPGTVDWPVKLGTTTVSQGAPGTNDWPVKLGTTTVNSGSRFLDVQLSTGIQANQGGTWNVNVTNLGSGSTVYVVNPTTAPIQIQASGGALTSVGYQTSGASVPVNVIGGTITLNSYVTFSSTYSTHISSSNVGTVTPNGEAILISSPGANTSSYLCGCWFVNTTATNGAIFIESPTQTTTNRIAFGALASYVNSGTKPDCKNPIFKGAANSNTYIFQNVATSAQAIYMNCLYFNAP